ncbi:hypothetical protein DSO57_1015950 [Entomophthora muscae]|uniref:Uncharacterized protein n=1 Tax=Entomophthora muscae TaxID=34485 RepID=A0ACC2SHS9_9FUNG|nr:hypothetical protein DSO57_1015950 [Entomophthora muscae]
MENIDPNSSTSAPHPAYQDGSYDSSAAQESKTRNAIASAKSRQKRKEREQSASQRNAQLLAQTQEAEKRNQALLHKLNQLKLEFSALQAELEILTKSQKLDQELDIEIAREIKHLKTHSEILIPGTLHNNPYELAKRQLQEAQDFYSVQASKVSKLKDKLKQIESGYSGL